MFSIDVFLIFDNNASTTCFVYWYTVGLNLVLDYLHYNMHRQFLLFAGMRGKHVCHFCIITAFSTQHVVSKRLVLNFG